MYFATTNLCVSGALIVLGLVLVFTKNFDCGEALDAVLATQGPVLVSVHSAQLDHTLQRGGGLLILGGQPLTVSAPRQCIVK